AWGLRPEGPTRGPLLDPDAVAALPLDDAARARLEQRQAGMVTGDPAQVHAHLTDLADQFGVEELVVLTVCHDPKARLRSYELLADYEARQR
ncbi:MAG: LLM class flavin-dependent oxidoreductase, partial [Acidimicrobiales bacterium]